MSQNGSDEFEGSYPIARLDEEHDTHSPDTKATEHTVRTDARGIAWQEFTNWHTLPASEQCLLAVTAEKTDAYPALSSRRSTWEQGGEHGPSQ